jgi:exodeoxyribonuclease VIII
MTNTEYHSKTTYLSKSTLDLIHRSPAHYKAFIEGEKQKPTAAMIFGSLVHALVFEQHHEYAIIPECDRRTKEGKAIYEAFLEESKGKEILVTWEQFNLAKQIYDSVKSHKAAAKLLSADGKAEVPFFGELEGVKCRCKADFSNARFIVDLKTTASAAPEDFIKSVYNYRYHVQAALYMDLMQIDRFFFIAVEKEAPFNVELYELDSESIEIGRQEYKKDIETYKHCIMSGVWPGYNKDQDITIISLPNWAKK